jgi:hypothetical protein
MVLEKKLPRRIFGCKREKVTAGWRKLCNEQGLHNLYFSLVSIRVTK